MNSAEATRKIDRRIDAWHMARALRLAEAGRGCVEPNPLVGCIIAHGAEIIGEGWHQRFGGPHAEIEALAVAGRRAAGATMYVTLEPCCHQGKTPPCTQAVIAAGLRRVVVAGRDPFPSVDGGGIAALEAAGIAVDVGLQEASARTLNAPYLKLMATGRPWVIAKWAMTLDGKIAARGGSSRWISGEPSRRIAHTLRGRVDAIVVGRGTAAADDPRLTARPSGPRIATRIVLDSAARLASDSQLVRSARQTPLLVAIGPRAAAADRQRLAAAGCEVWVCHGETPQVRIDQLLCELGRRRMTNVLVEGGGTLLGNLLDGGLIDEVHVFIAPKLLGGATAPVALGGVGFGDVSQALALVEPQIERLDGDVYVHGHVARPR
jgi:diaminohydroxyphosphoribosylaminopyrimidine deaminase / 5-amino-6-(5-phosphoribosylamino)uracil reductase